MKLRMRCQYCSESKDVECDATNSASRRCEIAAEHGWTAHVASKLSIPMYFCSDKCSHAFKVQKKIHLEIVGRVNR